MKLKELANICGGSVVKIVDISDKSKKVYPMTVVYSGLFLAKGIKCSELNEKEVVHIDSKLMENTSLPMSELSITVRDKEE